MYGAIWNIHVGRQQIIIICKWNLCDQWTWLRPSQDFECNSSRWYNKICKYFIGTCTSRPVQFHGFACIKHAFHFICCRSLRNISDICKQIVQEYDIDWMATDRNCMIWCHESTTKCNQSAEFMRMPWYDIGCFGVAMWTNA